MKDSATSEGRSIGGRITGYQYAKECMHDSNLLVIVIDTNPFEWEHPSAPLKLNEALQHILAFMNAHLAGRHDNKLAVIASHVGVSKFLYPTLNEATPGSKVQTKKDANVYQVFKVINDAVLLGITKLLEDTSPTLEEKDLGSSKIAASLSLGLCYINQALKSDGMGHLKPRILVLTVSPDSSSDYIPIMNCIFSAQKADQVCFPTSATIKATGSKDGGLKSWLSSSKYTNTDGDIREANTIKYGGVSKIHSPFASHINS
ncbi:RNA polymerase II transcription factor B subunit 4 [Entomortierella chlamydospora]|uniref:General transcription and DNA repair factor IIH subunit TFB4 n=1 Tax=Entomortierella chlamydospora TaxID=101097 RepID=A0A9P6N0Z7_9FUNG|nr:RNA polymerase II transcription factor B subunit 4 [Entomortierella chlamydospora]